MKLVTFAEGSRDKFRVGVLGEPEGNEIVVDLSRVDPSLPTGMKDLLRAFGGDFRPLSNLLRNVKTESYVLLKNVILGPVIPDPEKIICVGLNYRDHAEETGHELPKTPTIFAKYANTLIGHKDPILFPDATTQVDYEAELAFIIGRRAKNISKNEAFSCVAGYTIFNDVSARDFQLRTSQWTLGKSFDGFGPIGPALVTRDEIPDPHALSIRLQIGDEILQSSNTRNMVFGIPDLVAHLSTAMTLEPGDVIATGTPAGVGFTRKPPRYLQRGETVRIEIEGLGRLENPVR